MDPKLQQLDLLDLLSERHILLRKLSEMCWNEQSDIYLSNSEWHIIARIYQNNQPTISFVSKQVDISRQATHKFIKNLESKGIVEIKNVENNKKEKCLQLTSLGKECFKKNEALKLTLEQKIADAIGSEQLAQLKEILKLDWRL